MSEIIKSLSIEYRPENEEPEIEKLKNLPGSVRGFFKKLPDEIKNKIFPHEENDTLGISSLESREKTLEEIITGFDKKTRENFMNRCVSELFEHGRFEDTFKAVGEEGLKDEIRRLLDLLWQNRGKRDDISLFNSKNYDAFFKARGDMANEVESKKSEIKESEDSVATTRKQRRLTETKTRKLQALEAELRRLTDSLKKFDEENGNSDLNYMYFRDVKSRQRKEKEWTEGVTITSEYLDPAEFSLAIAEQLDKTFHAKSYIAKNPEKKLFNRSVSESTHKRA